ncbi:recombination regulator RecX [Ornithinibacillus halophilus]|uniref:Regulatory protein RecX n=1 Tax=Ornithinibacillus halophilus TaxID=930117 RepID=A0A1M5MNV1_9BACI|nr:recombination regulator RecX [Ornithinibacillus halophilus]SHG78722.1 regulatory protein [Ornithinibacillus halophilus]
MTVVISRITTQKKSKSRYNIFLKDGESDKYGFSVDETVLIEYGLRKGLELDEETMDSLIQEDSFQKSYTMAINFLSYRMRSTKEIRDYLVKKEVEHEQIVRIVEKLVIEGYLDDQQFANAFVQTRINTSSKGPLIVKKELMEKGVSAQIAAKAVELYTYEVQFEKALKFAEKKLKTGSKHAFRKQLQQVGANLIQKGFIQGVIQEVLQEIESEKNDDSEWEAVCYQGEKLMRKHERKYEGFELEQKIKEGLYRKGFTMDHINRFLDELKEEM